MIDPQRLDDRERELSTQDIQVIHKQHLRELWSSLVILKGDLEDCQDLTVQERVTALEKLVKAHKELVTVERTVHGLSGDNKNPLIDNRGGVIMIDRKLPEKVWEETARAEVAASRRLPEG